MATKHKTIWEHNFGLIYCTIQASLSVVSRITTFTTQSEPFFPFIFFWSCIMFFPSFLCRFEKGLHVIWHNIRLVLWTKIALMGILSFKAFIQGSFWNVIMWFTQQNTKWWVMNPEWYGWPCNPLRITHECQWKPCANSLINVIVWIIIHGWFTSSSSRLCSM